MTHADMVVAICLILTDWTQDDLQKLRAISKIMDDDEALGRPFRAAKSMALTQLTHADVVRVICLIITAITDGDGAGHGDSIKLRAISKIMKDLHDGSKLGNLAAALQARSLVMRGTAAPGTPPPPPKLGPKLRQQMAMQLPSPPPR
jgi:hypothetical protein